MAPPVLRQRNPSSVKKETKKSASRKPSPRAEDMSSTPHPSDMGIVFPSGDTAFKALLSARFCAAIWSHISDCDETYNYWEPAHYLLFGKGFQTWEYSPVYGLRSYTYVLLHAVPAYLYHRMLQPNRMLIFYFTRCLLGLLCAFCEVFFYKISNSAIFANLIPYWQLTRTSYNRKLFSRMCTSVHLTTSRTFYFASDNRTYYFSDT